MAQITIIAVENTYKATATGGYNMLEVSYKKDGKVTARKVMDFTNKGVYNALKDAKNGEVYDVTEQKNKNDYWEFASATKADGISAPSASAPASGGKAAAPVPKSNYETSEERAARQVMIVRQSSLSNAATLLTLNGDKKTTPEQVIQVARQFESYVLGTEAPQAASKAVAAAKNSDFVEDTDPIVF